MALNNQPQLLWLQALRGVAALLVVLFHLAPHAGWLGKHLFKWGFLGVDVFFVISGFVVVITSESKGGVGASLDFLRKRLLRIYLGYWPVLVLWVLMLLVLGQQPDSAMAVDSLFLLNGTLAGNWLPTAWSLFYELEFYLLCAAVIAVVPTQGRPFAYCGVLLALAIWQAYCILFFRDAVLSGAQPLATVFSGFGIEFLAGALIAHYRSSIRCTPLPLAIVAVVAVQGFATGNLFTVFSDAPAVRPHAFGLIGIALLIATLSLEATRIRPPSVLVKIGNASFSLYLLHPIVVALYPYFAREFNHAGWTGWLSVPAMLVVCVTVSLLWFRYVENPVYRFSLMLTKKKMDTPAYSVGG